MVLASRNRKRRNRYSLIAINPKSARRVFDAGPLPLPVRILAHRCSGFFPKCCEMLRQFLHLGSNKQPPESSVGR